MNIIFYNKSKIFWSPESVRQIGFGASEIALMTLAEHFFMSGHNVTVYAAASGNFNGVNYKPYTEFTSGLPSDILIVSRTTQFFNEFSGKNKNVLWVHDVDCSNVLTPSIVNKLDYIICGTNWHSRYLREAYPMLRDCEAIDLSGFGQSGNIRLIGKYEFLDKPSRLPKIVNINLGLNPEAFVNLERKEYSFIWPHMPSRGLLELLRLWPKIKEMWPLAVLNIYYGWDIYDLIFRGEDHRRFKWTISSLVSRNKDVKWYGLRPQDELIKKFCETDVWFYPPNFFQETFCTAALEAQAAGCLCISRNNGSLSEVVGDRGVLMNDFTPADLQLKYLISAKENEKELRNKSKQWALQQTWSSVAEKWRKLLCQQ